MKNSTEWLTTTFYATLLAGCSAASYWHTTHADDTNSDYSPIEGPKNITLAWKRKVRASFTVGTTVDGKKHLRIVFQRKSICF